MANLNTWQRIDRVMYGLPFGTGVDGTYSSATIPTLTKDSCSGTATSTGLITASSTFANGDIILIHQTRGTGAGQWEINKVISGGGSASLTLFKALNYTYTDSGASQAQAVKIPQYTNVTVQSGTWTVPAWDGNVGGILPIAVKGTLTITGTIAGNGGNGSAGSGGVAGGSGGGFYGGNSVGSAGNDGPGVQGEGTAGAGSQSQNQNGNGGGGGLGHPGGGGGNGSAGGNAFDYPASGAGQGGAISGTADLINIVFGGGGGGGGKQTTYKPGSGGSGAAIVMIFAKTIATITGAINLIGGNGGIGDTGTGGGGGAGGSTLIACKDATLGTTKITATGGTGGTTGSIPAGDGGTGLIAIHHSGTVTGTSNPTFNDTSEPTLIEMGGSLMMGSL